MTASNTIDGEELAWLHALARALVSGGESPEDLAQETALRALELERPDGAPILRPPGLEGDWKLRAQRGDDPEGPWRGGWTYGTDEASIEFSAVDAGYWWFRISQTDDFDDPVAEYVFEVSPGDDLLSGN